MADEMKVPKEKPKEDVVPEGSPAINVRDPQLPTSFTVTVRDPETGELRTGEEK